MNKGIRNQIWFEVWDKFGFLKISMEYNLTKGISKQLYNKLCNEIHFQVKNETIHKTHAPHL